MFAPLKDHEKNWSNENEHLIRHSRGYARQAHSLEKGILHDCAEMILHITMYNPEESVSG